MPKDMVPLTFSEAIESQSCAWHLDFLERCSTHFLWNEQVERDFKCTFETCHEDDIEWATRFVAKNLERLGSLRGQLRP